MPEPTIKVENVVANAKFADKFDLTLIESKLEGAVYDRSKFPGLGCPSKLIPNNSDTSFSLNSAAGTMSAIVSTWLVSDI